MIRRLLLATVFAALPIGAFAQSAGGVATGPATAYNGGSLVTAGDAMVGPVHTVSRTSGDIVGPIVQSLAADAVTGQVGNALAGSGSGTPAVDGLTTKLGTVVNGLAGKLATAGADIQANGLAGAPVVGSTVGKLGQTVDDAVNPLASITVLDRQVAGSPGGAQLLNASVLSSTLATNAPVVASVLAGGQVASVQGVSIPGGVTGGGSPLGGVLGGGTGGGAGSGVLSPVTNLVSGLTGGLGGGSGSGAGGLVGGVLNTVTGTVGGVTGGGSGSGAGGLVGGVLNTVTGLTGGLAGGNGGLLGGLAGKSGG